VASTILMALERVKTAAALAVPVVPLALAGHLAVIPRFGAAGAASVTAAASWLLALASLAVLYRVARVTPPMTSLLRVAGLVAFGAWLAAYLPGEGLLLPARLLTAATGVVAVALACGEVRISTIRSLFAGREGDA
jgi:peptidoglycan biosynthesis protein MviN/MurJ (putative lipid II flippase)